jgi:alpha-galactosidase
VQLKPILHGWCSWFYTRIQATEAEQLRNAAFIAQHLKPYGMQWVQIDDGYQRAFGSIRGRNPHGDALQLYGLLSRFQN